MKQFCTIDDALKFHGIHSNLFGSSTELINENGLSSALDSGRNYYLYENANDFQIAAKTMLGILQNHPFQDGNKRTGFGMGVLCLRINGVDYICEAQQAADMVLRATTKEIDIDTIAQHFEKHSVSREYTDVSHSMLIEDIIHRYKETVKILFEA